MYVICVHVHDQIIFCGNGISVAGTLGINVKSNTYSESISRLHVTFIPITQFYFVHFLSVSHLGLCGIQTVELCDCEKTQALALQVLLSLSKFNQHRIHEMDCYHGYSMIHQVLIKSKCIVGYHMLKVSHTLTCLPSSVPTTIPNIFTNNCFQCESDPTRYSGASQSRCMWHCCYLTLWLCL